MLISIEKKKKHEPQINSALGCSISLKHKEEAGVLWIFVLLIYHVSGRVTWSVLTRNIVSWIDMFLRHSSKTNSGTP